MINRWKTLCREMGGWRLASLYIVHAALQRAVGPSIQIVPYAFYVQPVNNPVLAAVKPDPKTTVRCVSGADAPLPGVPRPAAVLRQRLRDGHECHVCEVKGQFAGCIWLGLGAHDEDEVRCTYLLPAHSVWDYDVFVEPRFRLGRTVGRLWAAVDRDLAQRGFLQTCSRISRFNRGSIGMHERLGARPVGEALFVTCGRWQLSWVPGQNGPSLSRHARPVVDLRSFL